MDEDMLFFKETPFPELPLWNQDEFLWIFKEALQHGTGIKMTYESADGSLSERTVFPEVLFFYNASWYTAAWCTLRNDSRTFKLSHVILAESVSDSIGDHGIADDYRENGIPWLQTDNKFDFLFAEEEDEDEISYLDNDDYYDDDEDFFAEDDNYEEAIAPPPVRENRMTAIPCPGAHY